MNRADGLLFCSFCDKVDTKDLFAPGKTFATCTCGNNTALFVSEIASVTKNNVSVY